MSIVFGEKSGILTDVIIRGIVDCLWSKDENIGKKWENAYFLHLIDAKSYRNVF